MTASRIPRTPDGVERLELRASGRRLDAAWWGPKPPAPTLVLLHEGLGCVELWRDWPQRLARESGLGVLAYSRWGYGRSEPVELPRPLDYMEREGLGSVGQVLDAAGVQECVLVGHSDGASITLVHAGSPRRHPSVRGLVLLAPHVFCEELSVQSIGRARDAYQRGELRARLRKYHGENVDGAFWGWNRAWLDPSFKQWNIESCLKGIEVPVLAVQGVHDEYGTLAQLDAIERGVRGPFTRRVLEGCGHSPHRDQPELTTLAVVTFASRTALAVSEPSSVPSR
jgi:pimeloyl-ACP methyl ester carboxylesterase